MATKEQVRNAILGSLDKWREIYYGRRIDNGSLDCPLCQIFVEQENCGQCPVKLKTGQPGCRGTPYYDPHGFLGKCADTPALKDQALRMYRFLAEVYGDFEAGLFSSSHEYSKPEADKVSKTSHLIFKPWEPEVKRIPGVTYMRVVPNPACDGSVILAAVDSGGNRLPAGYLLTIKANSAIYVHQSVSDEIPILKDKNGKLLVE